MFGLRPIWFHTTNILLHAAACILFTRVCSKIAGFRWNFTILAGVLFAVHPIHTEAVSTRSEKILFATVHTLRLFQVTGIVGRADVLACIFFLLSVLIYHG
jgi:protein O-mannosyl-transferase